MLKPWHIKTWPIHIVLYKTNINFRIKIRIRKYLPLGWTSIYLPLLVLLTEYINQDENFILFYKRHLAFFGYINNIFYIWNFSMKHILSIEFQFITYYFFYCALDQLIRDFSILNKFLEIKKYLINKWFIKIWKKNKNFNQNFDFNLKIFN